MFSAVNITLHKFNQVRPIPLNLESSPEHRLSDPRFRIPGGMRQINLVIRGSSAQDIGRIGIPLGINWISVIPIGLFHERIAVIVKLLIWILK